MKDHKNISFKQTEIILISLMWLVLIASPFLFMDGNKAFTREIFRNPLETLIPLFLLFLINRFLLVPKLLFQKKRVHYFASVALIILLSVSISYIIYHKPNQPFNQPMLRGEQRMHPPNQAFPPPAFNRPLVTDHRPIPPYANLLIFSLLLIGFDTGLKLSLKGYELEKEKEVLEKENIANQLDMLRHQVSPHFFMNTLNNIHTLIDISSEDAKSAVIKLSKMMRYLLYETEQGSTRITKEIEFMESYIELMKLRISDKVEVKVNISNQIPNKNIPPLLFTSFLENAFKHGISYKMPSYIHIDLVAISDRLVLQIKNSKAPKSENLVLERKGIGLENAKKRLDLLYAEKYHLDIVETDLQFSVNLSIPL